VLVSHTQLFPQMQRALEVPRHRLVDVCLVGVGLDHPVGEALVKIRPQLLGKASVRGLEDERVCEAPPTGGLVLRLDETSSFERVHRTFEVIRIEVGDERPKRGDPEASSLDRRALEDEAWSGIEVIEPRREQRVQRPGISTSASSDPPSDRRRGIPDRRASP
jgi:hypothetical protein